MARTIYVEPDKLEAAATKIEGLAGEYHKKYTALMSEVEAMGKSWEGADNIAYVTQVKDFADDFDRMKQLMTAHVEFLRATAQNYRETQQRIIDQITSPGAKALRH